MKCGCFQLHLPFYLWPCIQVRGYKFPSEKDLKHINRKLKSCWGLSSHDEYFLILLSYNELIIVTLMPPFFLIIIIFCVCTPMPIFDCLAGARNGRRNQSTSQRRVQTKHKMCLLILICKSCPF